MKKIMEADRKENGKEKEGEEGKPKRGRREEGRGGDRSRTREVEEVDWKTQGKKQRRRQE